ncbi:hypothetical protein BV25DRAFT_1920110 [Artomyces pyxidatus]|uniref:Uncharacterized protein n=1 Tax=Artomyces pyxidatus TaxID=48021 RepID=A0ACB8SNK1_9AGAM|nr:hypothetical protein BV25DRAFT_1920110 [Artomyces pyxidatus]
MSNRDMRHALADLHNFLSQGEKQSTIACQNCHKHYQEYHDGLWNAASVGDDCILCLPPGTVLRRCSQCKYMRYCSKACQKADWKAHRDICKAFVEDMPGVMAAVERKAALTIWCSMKKTILNTAAASAVRFDCALPMALNAIAPDWMNFAFLVIVRSYVRGTWPNAIYTHEVQDAKALPRSTPIIQTIIQRWLGPETDVPTAIRPVSGKALTIVLDLNKQAPFNTVIWQGVGTGDAGHDMHWLANLKTSLGQGQQAA